VADLTSALDRIRVLEKLLKRWEDFCTEDKPWYVPEELLTDTDAALRPKKVSS